jgi:histidine triad (HIT) family protein
VTAYDDSNIFAKMLRGEIPAHKVYEDDDVLVTMDIFPQSRGHTLVIPKAPSRNLLDADPAVLGRITPTVQRVAQAVMRATRADGIRLVQYNEAPAGQSVFHLHFHLMPVYDGEPFGAHGQGRGDDIELAALAREIATMLCLPGSEPASAGRSPEQSLLPSAENWR